MSEARIKIQVTLSNREGFTSTDTVEDAYLTDPPSNELDAEVRRITGSFRSMMEVIRATAGIEPQVSVRSAFSQTPGAAAPRRESRRKLRIVPSRIAKE